MGQINTREVVLLGLTTATQSITSGTDINMIQGWQAATITLNISTVSGTSPTLDVYILKKLGSPASTDLTGSMPTGTAIYDDVLHFTQMTTSNTIRVMNICTGAGTPTANASTVTTGDWANSVKAIAAAAYRVGPIGGIWQVQYTLGGTSPSFAFSVTAQLIPFGT